LGTNDGIYGRPAETSEEVEDSDCTGLALRIIDVNER
jgi:hypothetical protein